MGQKMTHKGIKRGIDARTSDDWQEEVRLRETKNFWVDQYGLKYSKSRWGAGTGDWPMYEIDLGTIEKLEE